MMDIFYCWMNQKSQSGLTELSSATYSHSTFVQSYARGETFESADDLIVVQGEYGQFEKQIEQLKYFKETQNLHEQQLYSRQKCLQIKTSGQDLIISTVFQHQRVDIDATSLTQQNQILKQKVQTLEAKVSQLEMQLSQNSQQLRQLKLLQFQLSSKSIQIQDLVENNNFKNYQLQELRDKLQRYEIIVAELHSRKLKSVIKEVPVYIEKDVLQEVPVPIYINQKEQKYNAQLFPMLGSSREENSIALNDSQNSQQQSDKGFSGKKQAKLEPLCRSIGGSNIGSQVVSSQNEGQNKSRQQATRQRRIKEIVEVPVYITEEIIREVYRPIVEKEVEKVMEKGNQEDARGFIRQVQEEEREANRQNRRLLSQNNSEEFYSESPRNVNIDLLLQSNEKRKDSDSQHEEEVQEPQQLQPQQSHQSRGHEDCMKIQEQSKQQLGSQSKIQVPKPSHQRQISGDSLRQKDQILLQVPVQIEKEIFVPIQLPIEIYIDRIVQKEIMVEKIVTIQVLSKESQIQLIPIEIPVEIQVEKVIRFEVERVVKELVPIQIPLQIYIRQFETVQPERNKKDEEILRQKMEVIEKPTEILINKQPQVKPMRQTQPLLEVLEMATQINIINWVQIPTQIYLHQGLNLQNNKVEDLKPSQKTQLQSQSKEDLLIVEVPTQIVIEKQPISIVQQQEVQHMIEKQPTFEVMQIPTEINIINFVEIPTQIYLQPAQNSQYIPADDLTISNLTLSQPASLSTRSPQDDILIIQVPTQIMFQKETIVEKIIEKDPIIIQKQVQVIKQIQVQKQVIREVIIEKQKIIEIVRQVPIQIPIERQVQKIVEVQVFIDREVQVFIDREVQVFIDREVQVFIDREVQVFIDREVQVFIDREVQVFIDREVQVFIDREVQVFIDREVQVFLEKIVEKVVQVEVFIPIEIPIEIIQRVEVQKIVYIKEDTMKLASLDSQTDIIEEPIEEPISVEYKKTLSSSGQFRVEVIEEIPGQGKSISRPTATVSQHQTQIVLEPSSQVPQKQLTTQLSIIEIPTQIINEKTIRKVVQIEGLSPQLLEVQRINSEMITIIDNKDDEIKMSTVKEPESTQIKEPESTQIKELEVVDKDKVDVQMIERSTEIIKQIEEPEQKQEIHIVVEPKQGIQKFQYQHQSITTILPQTKEMIQPERILFQVITVQTPIEIIIERVIQVQKIVEVVIEKPVEIIFQVQKRVEVIIEKEVEKPIFVEKFTDRVIEKQLEVIREVPVEKIVEIQKIVYIQQMGEIIEVPVQKIVQVQKIVEVQRIVEVETMGQIVQVEVEKIVEVQRIVEVERIVEVQRIVEVETMGQIVEVEIQKIIYIEKEAQIIEIPLEILVQKQVIVQKEVTVEVIVEREVQPCEIIVQKVVYVDKFIEKVIEKEVVREQILIIQTPIEILLEQEGQSALESQSQKSRDFVLEVPVQVQKIVYVDKIVEIERVVLADRIIPLEIPTEIIIVKTQTVQVQVPIQVTREVIIQKQVIVEKPIYTQKEVIRQIEVERIVQIPKQIEIIKQVQVQVIKEVIVQRIIREEPVEIIKYVDRQVIKEKEVMVEIAVQIEKEVIKEVIVQKIVYVEVVKEIYIDKEVFIEKEVEKEVFIEMETDKKGTPIPSKQDLTQSIEQLELRQSKKQNNNQGVLLSDRSSESPDPEETFHIPFTQQQFQVRQGGWQQQKQALILHYSEHQRRLQEEINFIRDEFMTLNQQVSRLQKQKDHVNMTLQNKQYDYEELRKKSKLGENVQKQKARLEKKLEQEIKNREKEKQLESVKMKELNQTISKMKIEIQNYKSHSQATEQRLMEVEKMKQNEVSQLYQQLRQKNYQLQDFFTTNQQLNQQFSDLKVKQQSLLNQKMAVDDELGNVKQMVQQGRQDQIMGKSETQQSYKQVLDETQRIYKNQIEELILKNYQVINQKNQQIAQLDTLVKQLEAQIGKANDFISNINKEPFRGSTFGKNNNKGDNNVLISQNQRLSATVDSLNHEIMTLNHKLSGFQKPTHKGNTQNIQQSSGMKIQKSTGERQSAPRAQRSRIRIQQISKPFEYEEQDIYLRMNKLVNQYAHQLSRKDSQLQKMKELLCMYETVIQDMQHQQSNPYQSRSYQGAGQGFYRQQPNDNKMQLDTNIYVSNLLRKITLLEDQVKFQKSQKLKMAVRVRELERTFEEVNQRQGSQNYQEDSQLIQKLVYELERQKDKCEQFRIYNQTLIDDMRILKSQLEILKNNSNIARNNSYSGLLEDLDDQFQKELIGDHEETVIKHYKNFKVKYIKALELTQLIKKQIIVLQMRVSKNCLDIVDNVKRYLKIIENNQKNGSNQRSRVDKGNFQRKQRQDQQLMRQIKKIDSSLSYEEQKPIPQVSLQFRQNKNRFTDLSLDNLIIKNPPREIKYFISFKLIQFGLDLLEQRQIDNLCPEKIFVMHFSPSYTDNMHLTLAKKQKPKQKVRLYQAPEVLVGQPESAKSYSWSIGIIIDRLFHGRMFYQKFGDILDHKDNYQFQDRDCRDIGEIVEQMIIKNREHRLPLESAHQELAAILK